MAAVGEGVGELLLVGDEEDPAHLLAEVAQLLDHDLAALAVENVVLNGVMMGLTPDEARERIDAVFEFAELEEFKELRLKNYSSGMTVRLAFAVMIQADTDILLIDEVLAVGDASFQQKCADVFHKMRDSGKTVVLVTHEEDIAAYAGRQVRFRDGHIASDAMTQKGAAE